MLTVKHSIVIDRPIELVFDYVTDIKRMVEWIGPTIEANQTSENPRGVGTTSSRVSQFLGRRIESEMETVEFEPNQLIVNKAISGPMPEFEERISVESVQDGTRVTIRLEGEPGGLFKLAMPILSRRARSQVANDLDTLKDLVEALDQTLSVSVSAHRSQRQGSGRAKASVLSRLRSGARYQRPWKRLRCQGKRKRLGLIQSY